MKKLILFLVSILVVQMGYNITFLLAQEDKESQEIKRCPSSHLVGDTNRIIPFCQGLILNDDYCCRGADIL